ncbi:3-dehydroquinate synthase [Lentibacillus sediminis]|uniref:3-dehydroquinate synthase n=1 Tax=Lentibacillus sediminis TaxID=1940529 RepID=UPI000C1C5A60|nr:3-dehydroquinate synthase [Lentibacillus sediminis]
MKKLLVHSSSHTYPVYIGENVRFEAEHLLKKTYNSILIITDEEVERRYREGLEKFFPRSNVHWSIIPSGEASKNANLFYQLHTDAIINGLDRKSLIIALGGGVVGDLAGFVAATFMRGIDYVQMPTTILAHDSSVGGKVAINHTLGKNLIGSFYPPRAVIYDTCTLQSLNLKEFRSGYAEIIKESLIADEEFFNQLLESDLSQISSQKLTEHLFKGIKIKANIVEEDEKEAGSRMYLNLGHTLGHAMEAELGYGVLTHGEAVAVGLLFSLHVSELHFSAKLPFRPLLHWIRANHYPLEHVQKFHTEAIISRMKTDKKSVNKQVKMVLLEAVGKPALVEITEDNLRVFLKSFAKRLVEE